jgi:4a-hydroxytetrahydrobiopterin dehydratase
MELTRKKCKPCEDKKTKGIPKADLQDFLDEVHHWTLAKDSKSIYRMFEFKDFIGAVNFVDTVADIAEGEGHHPDIMIEYNKVTLTLSTHSIDELTENDFIVAAKIDDIMHRV